jgi:hypothetical protein
MSRGRMAQLEVAYTSWMKDVHNWNACWDGLMASIPTSSNPRKDVSQIMMENLERTMKQIQLVVRWEEESSSSTPSVKFKGKESSDILSS